MFKPNIKNELIKRKFFRRLKQADGRCDSTINNIEKAILIYEEFTKNADFTTYSPHRAIEFKEWLKKRTFRSKQISLTTYHTYLRYLRQFFSWLSGEPGYKSKITPNSVAYLNISEKEERMATQATPRNYPSLEHVLKLTASIKITSEIDQRDRALIAFTLLSGMRDKAIATLPLSCFDENKLSVTQNPRLGVQTKFSKYISTTLFRFDEKLVNYIIEWVRHLKNKGFGTQEPLFPRSKADQGENNLSFEMATEIGPAFWQGAGQIRGIFNKRAQDAGLPYFPPHTFRHLAIDLALKHCKTGEQIKAISQNFGHEHVATTLSSYANYAPDRLSEILKNIDFLGKPAEGLEERIEKLLRKLEKD